MSSTDQAFIRVFDSQAHPRSATPHVSFAARGVHVAAGFEPVIVCGGDSSTAPSETAAVSPAVASAPTTPPAKARQSEASPRARAAGGGAATYLPSSYRNLVDVEVPYASLGTGSEVHRQHRSFTSETARRPTADEPDESPGLPELRPALEVDALRWPQVVPQLLEECGEGLGALGEALDAARQRGEQVIVFHSTARRAGCTTMTLATARLLAKQGRSVAVVDAEFLRPHLATAVGLSLADGWECTLFSDTALAEFVVRSLEDGVVIVPLAAPLGREQTTDPRLIDRVASAWRLLAAHYDVVLIDGGCPDAYGEWEVALNGLFAEAADACVVVCPAAHENSGNPAPSPLDGKLPIVGIVENSAAENP